jgi:hypothetical protein
MQEIDERIRLKAMNSPAMKPKVAPPLPKPSSEPKPGALGSGISEEDVERIMKDFSKR